MNKEPTPIARANPQAPIELEQVVAKALVKDATLRYQTAADLGADLRRLAKQGDTSHSMAHSVPSVVAATPAQPSDPSVVASPAPAPVTDVSDILIRNNWFRNCWGARRRR